MIHFTRRAAIRIRPQSSLILPSLTLLLFVVLIAGLARTTVSAQERKLLIVTTTGIIADTVSQVGGEFVEVKSLMGEGVDPHLYKASPGDMKKLLEADLVFHNGLHLEGKMADALEKLASRKPVAAVSRTIPKNLLRSPENHPEGD